MKRNLIILGLLFCVATQCQARPGDTVIPMVAGRIVATVPFGDGELDIRHRRPAEPGEGFPIAFALDRSSRIHLLIPHERAIIVLSPEGRLENKVYIRHEDGSSLRSECFLFDLAIDDKGNYLVLEQAGGTILRVDEEGRVRAAFGTFVHADALEVLPGGKLAIRDRGSSCVNLFDQRGRLHGYIRDARLQPLASPQGEFARTVLVGKHRGFLWLRHPKRSYPRLIATIDPREAKAALYEVRPVGFTTTGDVVVITTEKGHGGYASHLLRLTNKGKLVGQHRLTASMEFAASVPRVWRLLDDETVLTFQVNEDEYCLVGYQLPTVD